MNEKNRILGLGYVGLPLAVNLCKHLKLLVMIFLVKSLRSQKRGPKHSR